MFSSAMFVILYLHDAFPTLPIEDTVCDYMFSQPTRYLLQKNHDGSIRQKL